MARQPLAVKYRPKNFDDMTEQSAIKDILTNQINTKTFQHGYLFTGPAGTGKTTSARIFANMINQGEGNPIEVDAASNSGVDNIRNIIDDAKKKPLDCEYKIFIIDECHSLSNGAWQALLKTLEESPKFSIFILCTTDPQKIPNTILSRVQRYQFNKISNDGIVRRLQFILEREKIVNYENEALEYIAKIVNGGMRDSITLLDKCLSLSKELTIKNVLDTVGGADYDILFNFVENLRNKDTKKSIEIVESIFNEGKDLKLFIKDFSKFILDLTKYYIFKSFKYISIPFTNENQEKIESIIGDDIYNILDLMLDITNTIKWNNEPKDIIEMMIINYCRG